MFPQVLKKFRDCVRDGKLVVTQHAFEEMNDDDLLQVDVEHCILTGEIFERQWDKEWNEWKYIICGESTEGDIMEVVIKVGHLESSIIITTYLV